MAHLRLPRTLVIGCPSRWLTVSAKPAQWSASRMPFEVRARDRCCLELLLIRLTCAVAVLRWRKLRLPAPGGAALLLWCLHGRTVREHARAAARPAGRRRALHRAASYPNLCTSLTLIPLTALCCVSSALAG